MVTGVVESTRKYYVYLNSFAVVKLLKDKVIHVFPYNDKQITSGDKRVAQELFTMLKTFTKGHVVLEK
mgnify:CR=1 FL=1